MQSLGDVEAQKHNFAVDTSVTYQPTDIQEISYRHPEPGTRLPIEFRTLSIHVETKASDSGDAKEDEKRKRAVKG